MILIMNDSSPIDEKTEGPDAEIPDRSATSSVLALQCKSRYSTVAGSKLLIDSICNLTLCETCCCNNFEHQKDRVNNFAEICCKTWVPS